MPAIIYYQYPKKNYILSEAVGYFFKIKLGIVK